MSWLEIEYQGVTYAYDPGTEVTFGRAGLITIGADNKRVHRTFGHIAFRNGQWRLTNVGSELHLRLTDEASRSTIELAPNGRCILTEPVTTISFAAGGSAYELIAFQRDVPDDEVVVIDRRWADVDDTVSRTRRPTLSLSPSQRLLVLAMCERRLHNPNDTTIPPSGEVAQRLGLTLRKFNKRLDEVCRRFSAAGFKGVHDPGGLATSRRSALVDAAVLKGIVTPADLVDLSPKASVADR
jgi:hypothetical protein